MKTEIERDHKRLVGHLRIFLNFGRFAFVLLGFLPALIHPLLCIVGWFVGGWIFYHGIFYPYRDRKFAEFHAKWGVHPNIYT